MIRAMPMVIEEIAAGSLARKSALKLSDRRNNSFVIIGLQGVPR